MYKNRIHRTNKNLEFQSFIRLCDIAFDERARYVEFVCNVWNEGRFGPGLTDPVILEDWTARPKPASAEFDDLRYDGPNGPDCIPSAISPPSALKISQGRADYQSAEAASWRAKQMGLLAATGLNGNNFTLNSASNQGGGSP